jgi:DNA-directed RNA polymerase subunit RPC12/RpoP
MNNWEKCCECDNPFLSDEGSMVIMCDDCRKLARIIVRASQKKDADTTTYFGLSISERMTEMDDAINIMEDDIDEE